MRPIHLVAAATAALAVTVAPRVPAIANPPNADQSGNVPSHAAMRRPLGAMMRGRIVRAAPGGGQTRAPAATPPTTQTLTFTFLDFPGTTSTSLSSMNLGVKAHVKQRGVGIYGASPSNSFLLDLTTKKTVMSESYSILPLPQSSEGAFGINDNGEIVGTLTAGGRSGFILKDGVLTQITVPYTGSDLTSANAINNAGIVVGAYNDASDEDHGFLYKDGIFTQVPDYPGAQATWPWFINTAGDLAGYIDDSAGNTHGYVLKRGTYTLLDYPGAAYTIALGLNDSDQVVGIYCITVQDCQAPTNQVHGFLYSQGTYSTIDVPGTTQSYPTGINNAGVIAGSYVDTNGFIHSYLTTP